MKIREGSYIWAFLALWPEPPHYKLAVSDQSMEKHLGAAGENIIWDYFNKKKKTEWKKVEHITWQLSMNCRYRLKLFSWQAIASILAMLGGEKKYLISVFWLVQ